MAEENVKPFKICSFNCNGLGEFKKRKDVFDFLRMKCEPDIVFLEETHWKTENENYIRSCWGYDCFIAGKDTNKNGVAILLNNTFEHKIHNIKKDPNGCFLLLDIEFLGRRVTLANIYGPSNTDNPTFFASVFEYIEEMGNPLIIAGGDWNVILDPKLDARNYSSFVSRPRSRKMIFEIMENFELVDAWRELYPNKRGYTWRKFNSVQQSRLDYFLVSDALLSEINGLKVLPGYRSDHSFVSLGVKNKKQRKDRPFWKFNNSLLHDIKYVDLVKKSDSRQQMPVCCTSI